MPVSQRKKRALAYIIGVALGDGNLSNPNGRAVRLRITCDARYPVLAETIIESLRLLLPENRVSIVPALVDTYYNISVYSNKLSLWMPWKTGAGSKGFQQVHVPDWIKLSKVYSKDCLRGLIQTDGCIYNDRGYFMVNFTSSINPLADDVCSMITALGFTYSHYRLPQNGKTKHTIRVARDAEGFAKKLGLFKK